MLEEVEEIAVQDHHESPHLRQLRARRDARWRCWPETQFAGHRGMCGHLWRRQMPVKKADRRFGKSIQNETWRFDLKSRSADVLASIGRTLDSSGQSGGFIGQRTQGFGTFDALYCGVLGGWSSHHGKSAHAGGTKAPAFRRRQAVR
jgi:hypothetical protein